MTADKVWLGNEAWPGNRSCGQFARDVFRIAGAKTDKQKALAFYDWFTRCMLRGPNPQIPNGAGGYSNCFDPLPDFVSWGSGECTYWGWIATECLNGAGLKARRVVVHNVGHTYYEVWYRGDDGIEQWHAFDPFGGWYFLNERGEVASCSELAARPQLVQNPLPGHPVPLGHHPERNHMAHRHRTEDQLFIDQPLRHESLDWQLQRGMEAVCTFLPEAPQEALFGRAPASAPGGDARPGGGNHCDIAEISRLGFRQCAAHIPYWRNYLRPTPGTGGLNEGRPVRWHGAGALRWKPLLQGASAAYDARNAAFADGCVRPAGRHDFCEVWYRFKLPFLVSFLAVDYDVAGAGGDYFGLSVSADDRRTIWPLATKSHAPHYGAVVNGQAQWAAREPSVQGLREFWLRMDLMSHTPQPTLSVQALNVTVGFQHNMFVQPMLVPGRNPLWIEAGGLENGASLEAEWIYQLRGEERRAKLALATAGTARRTVNIAAKSPTEILMTGVRLACR
jgi:hypothetical protein